MPKSQGFNTVIGDIPNIIEVKETQDLTMRIFLGKCVIKGFSCASPTYNLWRKRKKSRLYKRSTMRICVTGGPILLRYLNITRKKCMVNHGLIIG